MLQRDWGPLGMRKVWLVGAGFISHAHAEAISATSRLQLHGVIDPNQNAAQALAARWGIPHVFDSAKEAIASGEVDCVHVLTPPDLHAETAMPFLQARIPVLIEKPLAATAVECESLISEARKNGVALGVHQNFVFHPAYNRLRLAVAERLFGRPNFISCTYTMPVRQIQARQFGHWMFRAPVNILLEQAVHPLSQIIAITGRVERFSAMPGRPIEISPGVTFYDSVSLTMEAGHLPAAMRFSVGKGYPFWQISVICDDGVVVADIVNNRFFSYDRGRWLEPYDMFFSGTRTGIGILRESMRNLMDFNLSTLQLKSRSDSFFQSVKASVNSFHQALDEKRLPELDGNFGAHLVSLCEDVARAAFVAPFSQVRVQNDADYDVAVLGGTGFIGMHVVRRLLAAGLRVGVMARNISNLPPEFYDDSVVMIRGDINRPTDVERAINKASIVINLAHGGGGKTYEEVRAAMVGGAEIVARACLSKGVQRLVHIGSIASLYLGSQSGVVTSSTPPDPKLKLRSDYSRAKADCDNLLLTMHKTEELPVCILRPGLVVGEGGSASHSGLGVFNNEQHCIGWNAGRNPLPFVLAEDVADAIVQACTADGVVGRTFNIVGDVRLSAREYFSELSQALGRPLRFHRQAPGFLWIKEMEKWLVKRGLGRRVPRPTLYDILSRGLRAEFDCSDAKTALRWNPVSDRKHFVERGIRVFATNDSAN